MSGSELTTDGASSQIIPLRHGHPGYLDKIPNSSISSNETSADRIVKCCASNSARQQMSAIETVSTDVHRGWHRRNCEFYFRPSQRTSMLCPPPFHYPVITCCSKTGLTSKYGTKTSLNTEQTKHWADNPYVECDTANFIPSNLTAPSRPMYS